MHISLAKCIIITFDLPRVSAPFDERPVLEADSASDRQRATLVSLPGLNISDPTSRSLP